MQTIAGGSTVLTRRADVAGWCSARSASARRPRLLLGHVAAGQLASHKQPLHVPRAVQEGVLKSDAEQFIESLQQDLPEAGDRSFLVAKDVEELQQRVQDLQQQVGLIPLM